MRSIVVSAVSYDLSPLCGLYRDSAANAARMRAQFLADMQKQMADQIRQQQEKQATLQQQQAEQLKQQHQAEAERLKQQLVDLKAAAAEMNLVCPREDWDSCSRCQMLCHKLLSAFSVCSVHCLLTCRLLYSELEAPLFSYHFVPHYRATAQQNTMCVAC